MMPEIVEAQIDQISVAAGMSPSSTPVGDGPLGINPAVLEGRKDKTTRFPSWKL